MTRYSTSTGTFYPEDIQYPALPSDLIDVSQEDFSAAIARPLGSTFSFIDGILVISPFSLSIESVASGVNASIKAEIDLIERGQARLIREQMLGIDGSLDRLTELNSSILVLRAKLTT